MKVKDSIAAEFDQFSGNYTEDMTKCVPHYPKLLSCFADCLPDDFSPDAVLDLGCGNGNVTALLLNKFPHAHYTLLDASPEMLALCKQRFTGNNVTCIERYFRDYHFPQCRFDLITASFSLHHLDSGEKQWIFPILFEALKPGGLFTCSDLMISKQHDQYETLCEEWRLFVDSHYPDGEKWKWLTEHHRIYDHPEDYETQKRWLLRAGFREIRIGWNDGYWMYFTSMK